MAQPERGPGGPAEGRRRFRGGPGAAMTAAPLPKDGAEKQILDMLEEMRQQGLGIVVPRDDGRLLRILAESIRATSVAELGTFHGYSGLWFCRRGRSRQRWRASWESPPVTGRRGGCPPDCSKRPLGCAASTGPARRSCRNAAPLSRPPPAKPVPGWTKPGHARPPVGAGPATAGLSECPMVLLPAAAAAHTISDRRAVPVPMGSSSTVSAACRVCRSKRRRRLLRC
jgi:hypothetical protein